MSPSPALDRLGQDESVPDLIQRTVLPFRLGLRSCKSRSPGCQGLSWFSNSKLKRETEDRLVLHFIWNESESRMANRTFYFDFRKRFPISLTQFLRLIMLPESLNRLT